MNRRQLQFLESVANIKDALRKSQGWTPNTRQAEDICSCLRQGRLFYDAASVAPLEIKPLQLYYGFAAFSKALVLGTTRGRYLSTLAQSHGIRDTSADNATLENIRVTVGGRGTFFEFNNVAASLNKLSQLRSNSSIQIDSVPAATSSSLEGLSFSLRDLLARIPTLEKLYRHTFDSRAKTAPAFLMARPPHEASPRNLILNDDDSFSDLESLRTLVENLRLDFPFLRGWTFHTVSKHMGKTHIFLVGAVPPSDEFVNPTFVEGTLFQTTVVVPPDAHFTNIASHIDPPARPELGPATSFYMVSPFEGHVLSEYSLQFLALHLLSSLVRYRPSIWMHSLSRASTHERRSDDRVLALIEQLMDVASESIPKMICDVLSPDR